MLIRFLRWEVGTYLTRMVDEMCNTSRMSGIDHALVIDAEHVRSCTLEVQGRSSGGVELDLTFSTVIF